jgi:hypothetical protein
VDSLDTWLNTQRGWRHFAVAWLAALPAGFALSLMWVASSNMSGPPWLGASAVLDRMALGVVASVPFAVLFFSIESLSRRRPSKRGKIRTPRYLWRGMVAMYILIADIGYSIFADAEPVQWRDQHDFFFAQIGFDAIAMALLIWNLQYWRRVKRRTAEVVSGGLDRC